MVGVKLTHINLQSRTVTPMIEQRLTDRLTKYWELIRKDAPFPPLESFNSAAVDDMWSNCMLFAVGKTGDNEKTYTFYRMGERVKAAYGADMVGQSLHAKHRAFKGADVVKRIDDIIIDPKPIYDAGQFVNPDNKVIKFRSCMLPFGKDSVVTHVIAGLSWREF